MASVYNQLLQELDESAGATYWNEGQPYWAINAAQIEVAARMPGLAFGTATLTLTTSQEFYSLPSTILVPQHFSNPQGKEVFPTTHALLEDWSAKWRNSAPGKPAWVVAWDVDTLRVFPKPDATYEYVVGGVPWPAEITSTGQEIDGQGQLQTVVVLLAAAQLLSYTQPELAQAKRLQAEEVMARIAKNLRKGGGQNTLRIRPGTGWSLARAGGDLTLGRRYQ